MRILYIYPHPDDESFGPARVISKQKRQGHEVYLLTLTRGGATKQRFKFNYTVEQMGEVRYKEMLNVAKVLNLNGMKVLDFPDSGLKELDPREIEAVIREEIKSIKPNVVVTYPVHGISGFHDHIVGHAAVKRVFCELKPTAPYLKRLAFETVTEEESNPFEAIKLNWSKPEEIDCVVEIDEADIQKCYEALDCYVTYQDVINGWDFKKYMKAPTTSFEIFQERHDPPLGDLCEGL
jgi:LmbE family N-acetylglucosaminyl deacetylase